MEGLNDLLNCFDHVGVSRGTMNGHALHVVSAMDEGYTCKPKSVSVLKHLRAYEKKKGISRSWRESLSMRIRQSVKETRAKKAGTF
jgi:hypothetical protein